jgi:hypothetical protein
MQEETMGKTQTPLNILLTDSTILEHPELKPTIDKMIAQGHVITADDSLSKYHFIAGPNCWYLVKEVAHLFEMAVEQARKIANADKKGTVKSTAKKAAKGKFGKGGKAGSKAVPAGEQPPSEANTI